MRTDVPRIEKQRGKAASAPITCTRYDDFGALGPLREEWDRLVEAVGSDVYFSYDWCRIWWQHYAYQRRLCVLVFRAGGELVGLAPMFIDRLRVGPFVVRLGRFIGSDSTLTVLNPPFDAQRATCLYAELLHQMLHVQGCDAVALGPLAGERAHDSAIGLACGTVAGARVVRTRATAVYNVYRLPPNCDEYLRSLAKRARREYERGRRQVDGDGTVGAESVSGDAALAAYDEFVGLHERQWRQSRKLGHFGDWPRATEFNRDVVRALAPLDRAGFYNLRADGDLVSSTFFLRFGRQEHWRLSARDTDQQWGRLHVGMLTQVQAITAALAAGVNRVEDGPGRYEYKTDRGALEYPLWSVMVARGVVGRLKTLLLCRVSELLHLAYYRIWFGRIAPRLPLRRRSLWVLWTRYHV